MCSELRFISGGIVSKFNYLVPAKIDLSWLQAELSLYSGLLNVVHAENTKVKHEATGYVELIAKAELEVKDLKSVIASKSAALEANEAKLVSNESENDLILLQLHQVQEAFESYLINNISSEKFEQQKELTKLTQEKLNSANEKYRKVTAQVQVLKDRLSAEQNSLCHKMGYYCENEANGFWKKFTLGFTIGKMRKAWTLESNKVNT